MAETLLPPWPEPKPALGDDAALVERVAKALFLEDERQSNGSPGEDYANFLFSLGDDAWGEEADLKRHADNYRSSARAALAASHIPDTEVVWQSMDTALMDGTPLMLFARAENATASVPVIGWYLEGEGWIAQTFAPNVPTKIVPSAWQPRPGFPTAAASA